MLFFVAVKPRARILVVALAAVGAAAGCGGRGPIEPGDGGSMGGYGGGSSGGHSGSAGTAGAAGAGASCDTLDEMMCAKRLDCTSQFCSVCPNQQPMFAGCTVLGTPPVECPAEACVQPDCQDLNEAVCDNRADCKTYYCPDCKGGQTFINCGAPGGGPGIECQSCPSSCAGLDETACANGCNPAYCPNCSGGRTFVGCLPPDAAPFVCPIACPGPAPCSSVTTQAACDARTDCHSVLAENGTCDCPIVTTFDHCADGNKVACKGTPTCQRVMPYCEPPDYAVSYTTDCYEGCVRPSECAP
jgi:hypothetical protein